MDNTPGLEWIDALPEDAKAALLIEAIAELSRDKLKDYRPYPKQSEFHRLGKTMRERLLRAGNQNGKTYCVAAEAAFHLTGEYPDDWEGRRWTRPVVVWASGETAETTRDNPQRALIGIVGEVGTGAVPARCIGDTGLATGVADLFDYVRVKHYTNGKFDGWSLLRFKYYAQGKKKWMGPPVDFVWFDEEPPEDIYDEGLARTIATGGMAALSFTPLQGMSEVVRRFMTNPTPDRADTNMTIHDAAHIPLSERERIIASFPAHERDARSKGVPTLGSGRIFPVDEELIKVAPFKIPDYWPRLCAVDFGYDHPFAAVWLAFDPDAGICYVFDCYKIRESTPATHVDAMKPRCGSGEKPWMPVAWPHDGHQHDKGSGIILQRQYGERGLNMLPQHAQHAPEGTPDETKAIRQSVEAGVLGMLDDMQGGRFKVFAHLSDWFDELRLYHRKDGKIVAEYDDVLSATRYGWMSKDYAEVAPVEERAAKPRTYNWKLM
jgi:phage terminase large subunit-like protein